jgi:Domain of unknown function (DUF397)
MEGMSDPRWRKSSYSGSNGGGCVEAGIHPHGVIIRDTQDPRWPEAAPVVTFTADAWERFTKGLK